jgi:hypothetical protein
MIKKQNHTPITIIKVYACCCSRCFVLSEAFAHESGLAVVVMGMVMGNMNLPNIKELFYRTLSVLLISIRSFY